MVFQVTSLANRQTLRFAGVNEVRQVMALAIREKLEAEALANTGAHGMPHNVGPEQRSSAFLTAALVDAPGTDEFLGDPTQLDVPVSFTNKHAADPPVQASIRDLIANPSIQKSLGISLAPQQAKAAVGGFLRSLRYLIQHEPHMLGIDIQKPPVSKLDQFERSLNSLA